MMKPADVLRAVCLVVSAGLPLGCGGSREAPASRPSRIVGADQLAELGDPIGPLDEQRIEVAPPKGWHVPPRSNRWIVRFTAPDRLSYPSILVTAEDYEGIFNVSKRNVGEFAKQLAARFSRELASEGNHDGPATGRAGRQAVEVTPIQIGTFIGARYRRRGKAPYGLKEIVVERLVLETVVAGRKYRVELRTREGELTNYRRELFAVAAGIKFLEPEQKDQPEKPEPEPQPESEVIEAEQVRA